MNECQTQLVKYNNTCYHHRKSLEFYEKECDPLAKE